MQLVVHTDHGRDIPWDPKTDCRPAVSPIEGETIVGATLLLPTRLQSHRLSAALLLAIHDAQGFTAEAFVTDVASCGIVNAFQAVVGSMRNHYDCSTCGAVWDDLWSCASDDDCPECGSTCTPHCSDVLTDVDQDGNGVFHLRRQDAEGHLTNDLTRPLLAQIAREVETPSEDAKQSAILAMRDCLFKVETQLVFATNGIDQAMVPVMLAAVTECSALATKTFGPR